MIHKKPPQLGDGSAERHALHAESELPLIEVKADIGDDKKG
jgi:hypothetical protein